ncbi:hypothetical protein QVD99_002314 [Batrachochytrium dendrobatidis]|nr:hypothetical protein O5D80_004940 [Batrachochytrium dendrobatidis]KAK5671284.1 hypothetical protein QVD99_002314 [Batrachochytrium dendrobatidis]
MNEQQQPLIKSKLLLNAFNSTNSFHHHTHRDISNHMCSHSEGSLGIEIWNVGGHLTEVLYMRASKHTSNIKHVAILYPGNPGIIQYYQQYAEALYRHFDGELEIVGCSYLGHASYIANNDSKIYSLDDQITHKVLFFDVVKAQYPASTNFILIGHSLGTYMSLKVLSFRQDCSIVKIVALFPTLHSMSASPNGRKASVYTFPPIRYVTRQVISCIVSILPRNLLFLLVSALTGIHGPVLYITTNMLTSSTNTANVLYLGACEMHQIRDLNDLDVISTHADKFIMYYGVDDGWSPVEHYQDMSRKVPAAKVMLCEKSVPHSFVVEHSGLMAKLSFEWLRDLVLQQ